MEDGGQRAPASTPPSAERRRRSGRPEEPTPEEEGKSHRCECAGGGGCLLEFLPVSIFIYLFIQKSTFFNTFQKSTWVRERNMVPRSMYVRFVPDLRNSRRCYSSELKKLQSQLILRLCILFLTK